MALLMAGCTEDYKDWAQPFQNGPEEPVSVSISVSPGAAVDFATITDETVKLFSASVSNPEGAEATYTASITNEDGSKEIAIKTDENFFCSTAELESAVNALWGRRPVARTIPVKVLAYVKVNGVAIASTGTTTLTATPNAPVIEEAYYITGTVNGWDNNNTDYELSNGGADPYENSIFTVMIPGDKVTGDIEFKVTPKSGLGGDWSKCLTASDTEGIFATNNAGGNLKVAYVKGAKFYRIQFDLMNQTWSGAGLSFGDYFYEIGNESGWGTSHALAGPANDGKYKGYYYLNGEFKFKPNADNWDDDLEYVSGTTTSGTLTDAGGPNCPDPGAGFYQIDLDLAAMTYKVTEVETISIIGTVKGNWDTDVDMTYNKETGAWEVTADLEAGEMKFRMNHDWSVSWGGNGSSKAYNDLTQNNGANLELAESGKYKVQLFIQYEGKNKVVLTKQ